MESKRSKYVLIGLSVFCIILIVVTSFVDGFLNPLRTSIGFFLNPIQSGVNKAGTSLYNGISNFSRLKGAMDEKEVLQAQIDQLIEENSRLQSEQFELERLRQLYELDQEYMQYEKIGARVIAKDSGDWFQVFRIDKGAADGVRVDANVMAGGGLVGIVTDVGAHYATVRSIIDDVSRVSAMAQQSGDSCIVAGDLTLFGEGRLRITNIATDGDIKNGDRIVTSNISSKFLPGILIGYASDITTDSTRLTRSGYLVPVAQFDSLQEVLVITELKAEMTQDEMIQAHISRQETESAVQDGTGEGTASDEAAETSPAEGSESGTGETQSRPAETSAPAEAKAERQERETEASSNRETSPSRRENNEGVQARQEQPAPSQGEVQIQAFPGPQGDPVSPAAPGAGPSGQGE